MVQTYVELDNTDTEVCFCNVYYILTVTVITDFFILCMFVLNYLLTCMHCVIRDYTCFTRMYTHVSLHIYQM